MSLNQGKHSKIVQNNFITELLSIVCLITFIIVMLYSGFRIISWKKENSQNKKIHDNIADKIKVNEDIDTINKDDLKDKYLIDFESLNQINEDIVGWTKVSGTNIDYTVLKSKDNEFYLTHSFDKTYNSAGWIFVDYANKLDGTDKNIVIYGHNRRDGSMFGTLKNILNEEWYTNTDNRYIPFITQKEGAMYEVFSVYKILEEEYYIKKDFNGGEFNDFLNTIKSRSIYDFNVDVNEQDRILTLSSCANDNRYRVVLHAKKI